MAKLARKLLTLFGSSGPLSNFAQFGSQVAGSPTNTKDILTIQTLSAWINGFQDAVYGSDKAPFLEEMNALQYVAFYELAYMLQEGMVEYDSTTTYYIGSIVKKTGTSEFYKSLTDSNLGNALPSKADNANWQFVINRGILQYDATYSYSIGEIAQKPGTAELYKSLTNANVGNALPSQVSSGIWQYLVDLANLAPPAPGVQSIKFGFATVQISSTVSATATISKNPVGDFGFDSDMAVYAITFLNQTDINVTAGAPTAFAFTYDWKTKLSGSGVDTSGNFLSGGAAATTFTLTLTLFVSSNIGQGNVVGEGTVLFIGIK